MQDLTKTRLVSFVVVLFIVSIACSTPYSVGFDPSGERQDGTSQAQVGTPTPTATDTPTPTNTATPTDTPEPTPTATLVVKPTDTPTAVPGAVEIGAPVGGPPPAAGEPQAPAGAPVEAPAGGGTVAPQPQPVPAAKPVSTENVIRNSSFEEPWVAGSGVAPQWSPFDNGDAHFGWYEDTWFKVVYDGEKAQLIEIIADQGQGDRYAGIFQTVDVVRCAEYELTIHGLVRSDPGSGEASGYSFVMQYGIDYNGGNDWRAVTEWIDLPFPEHPREDPEGSNVYNWGTYTARIVPPTNKLTLYIRAWTKWASPAEGNWDIDAVSLRGVKSCPGSQPAPAPAPAVPTPTPGAGVSTATPIPQMPVSGQTANAETPAPVIVVTMLSILVLFGGAVINAFRQRFKKFEVDISSKDDL